MKNKLLDNTFNACALLFLLLFAVHAFEAMVLRTDKTFFNENFINKLFGVVVMLVILNQLGWSRRRIGFSASGIVKHLILGLLLAAASFSVAYSSEAILLTARGKHISCAVFTTGFSLTGNTVVHSGISYILLCVFFNIINVVMEEGTFRGLFYELIKTNHSAKTAMLMQAALFGLWHIVTPLCSLLDGEINAAAFATLSVGYMILAEIMGVKWGLMYQMTGSLYAGMADHFFNNCVATNLLHIVTETGVDEMMILRVLIAQTLSFIIVVAVYKKIGLRYKS